MSRLRPGPLQVLTGFAVITTTFVALMAGFFYAYASSVMIGLANATDATFIESMQAINASVRNVWFGPAFFGSLILPAALTVILAIRGYRRAAFLTGIAFLAYLASFIVTLGISVPLNNELRDAGPIVAMSDPVSVRDDYETPWVRWNIVRTVTSALSLVAMVLATWSIGRQDR